HEAQRSPGPASQMRASTTDGSCERPVTMDLRTPSTERTCPIVTINWGRPSRSIPGTLRKTIALDNDKSLSTKIGSARRWGEGRKSLKHIVLRGELPWQVLCPLTQRHGESDNQSHRGPRVDA